MVTALSVLLLSAVGGGIIGSLLTTAYPKENICGDCENKSNSGYERDVGYYDDYGDDEQYSSEQYGY